jgi:hypothetical protein
LKSFSSEFGFYKFPFPYSILKNEIEKENIGPCSQGASFEAVGSHSRSDAMFYTLLPCMGIKLGTNKTLNPWQFSLLEKKYGSRTRENWFSLSPHFKIRKILALIHLCHA